MKPARHCPNSWSGSERSESSTRSEDDKAPNRHLTKTNTTTPLRDPFRSMVARKSDSALLAELTQDQLHLKKAGKLNGTTAESRARLQDAISRGLDLQVSWICSSFMSSRILAQTPIRNFKSCWPRQRRKIEADR